MWYRRHCTWLLTTANVTQAMCCHISKHTTNMNSADGCMAYHNGVAIQGGYICHWIDFGWHLQKNSSMRAQDNSCTSECDVMLSVGGYGQYDPTSGPPRQAPHAHFTDWHLLVRLVLQQLLDQDEPDDGGAVPTGVDWDAAVPTGQDGTHGGHVQAGIRWQHEHLVQRCHGPVWCSNERKPRRERVKM